MITGEMKSKVDRLWSTFWSNGISNPLSVIEQISYLLFIKRLDDLELAKERKATRLGRLVMDPIFGPEQQRCRWSHFRNLTDAEEMLRIVRDEAFPFIKRMGGGEDASAYARHMRDAVFMIVSPALLANVVGQIDQIPMEDRDTKGDLYEYMLSKLETAGQNGQFRTPRHIIKMMVQMMAPGPREIVCDPACGTGGRRDRKPRAIRASLWTGHQPEAIHPSTCGSRSQCRQTSLLSVPGSQRYPQRQPDPLHRNHHRLSDPKRSHGSRSPLRATLF